MRSERESFKWDKWLLIPLLLLIVIGVVIVYTSSYYLASIKHLGQFHYLIKHFARLAIGMFLFLVALVTPLPLLKKYSKHLLLISFALLFFTFVEGKLSHGAKRWISVGPFSFQPSELAKFSILIYLATYLGRESKKLRKFKGFLYATAPLILTVFLVAIQPSLSMAFIIFTLGMTILFVGGARLSHILLPVLIAGLLIGVAYKVKPEKFAHARERIEKFKNIESNYQVLQAHIGMAHGGLSGVGIGRGKQKFLYLPEPYTDFIYAVIGEELGFMGSLLVLLLYLILAVRGFQIATVIRNDPFQSLLAFGMTMMIIINVLINISVVLGIVPTTGEPLPFISYGGSAMLFNLAAMGILMRISSKVQKIREDEKKKWKLRRVYSL